MLVKIKTFSLLGIDAVPVDVEVDVALGSLPKTTLVGLPEAAVRESTRRPAENHGYTQYTDETDDFNQVMPCYGISNLNTLSSFFLVTVAFSGVVE